MKLLSLQFVLLAALLSWAAPTLAQPDMPPVLAQELGLMDGCTVLESSQVYDAETCRLDCGDIHPNQVATYYKRHMDNNGFTNTTLGGASGGALGTGEKNGATASALAVKEDGSTKAMLSVDNIEALGGTPVDPNAPAEGEAAAEQPADTIADSGDAGTADAAAPADGQGEPAAQEETPVAQTEAEAAPMTDEQMDAATTGALGQGLAAEIWEYVTPRAGDTLIEEMVLHSHPVAIFATDGPIDAVLNYYKDALEAQGWMKLTHMVEAEGGILIMVTQGMQFQVICESGLHPDHKGLGYSTMLAKAPQ